MKGTLKDGEGVEVSVVFPAFNERDHLEDAVRKTIQVLDGVTESYEIIIAEDGSMRARNCSAKKDYGGHFFDSPLSGIKSWRRRSVELTL
jgi:hypothetical protein